MLTQYKHVWFKVRNETKLWIYANLRQLNFWFIVYLFKVSLHFCLYSRRKKVPGKGDRTSKNKEGGERGRSSIFSEHIFWKTPKTAHNFWMSREFFLLYLFDRFPIWTNNITFSWIKEKIAFWVCSLSFFFSRNYALF